MSKQTKKDIIDIVQNRGVKYEEKGFTLIELLAVIVILAIIAIIAVPQILGVVETSRQNVVIESTKGYIESISDYITLYLVGDKDHQELSGTYQVNKDIPYGNGEQSNNLGFLDRLIEKVYAEEIPNVIYLNDIVNVKGRKPDAGYVTIENNKVIYAELIIDNYNVTYDIARDPVIILNGKVGSDITPPSISINSTSKTISSAVITYTVEDKESGVKEVSCKYGLENNNYVNNGISTETSCSITNLNSNTTYYYQIIAKNNDGSTRKITGSFKTSEIIPPTIVLDDETTDWKQSRKATITYNIEGISEPKYFVKTSVATTSNINGKECEVVDNEKVCNGETTTSLKANTWYEVTGNVEVTFTSEGNIYAELDNGEEYLTTATKEIAYIDSTGPIANIALLSSTPTKAEVSATCSDESGITKIEYSSDNGKSWIDRGLDVSYEFTGLTSGDTYNFKVRCTNGSGLTTTSTGISLAKREALIDYTLGERGSGEATVNYSATNISNPVYYLRVSNIDAKLDVEAIPCGEGNEPNPSVCDETLKVNTNTNLNAGIWYKVGKDTKVSTTTETSITPVIYDGDTYIRNQETPTQQIVKGYNVTVNKGTGIESVTGDGLHLYGESVTIGYTVSTGYHFKDITGDQTTNPFTMPANNVSVTVNGEGNTYTITYDYNGKKNYGTSTLPIEKSDFSGKENDCFGWFSIDMSGLTANDKIKIEFDYEYTNLTTSPSGSWMRPQYYGSKNSWNVGIGFDALAPVGSSTTVHYSSIHNLQAYEINEEIYYGNIRADGYTGGSITVSNYKVTRVTEKIFQRIYGNTMGELPVISEDGYVFDGWYTEPNGGTKISSSTPVPAANTIYYAHWIPKTYDFDYTGNVQSFKVPFTGPYKLEVWGAQGSGDYMTSGSLGGYAVGNITLNANQELNICVGSLGYASGYNGGGARYESGVSGGGATHIAKTYGNYTTLDTYQNENTAKNYVYIVAGGAGGSGDYGAGGTGGGVSGGTGAESRGYTATGNYSKGGTQTTGYAFGKGQDAWGGQAPAGGGGWYGGYAGGTGDGEGMAGATIGAGGGSGYLNTSLGLTNGSMQNGVREGNGFARITYLGN